MLGTLLTVTKDCGRAETAVAMDKRRQKDFMVSRLSRWLTVGIL
jgi:hypothetical protein